MRDGWSLSWYMFVIFVHLIYIYNIHIYIYISSLCIYLLYHFWKYLYQQLNVPTNFCPTEKYKIFSGIPLSAMSRIILISTSKFYSTERLSVGTFNQISANNKGYVKIRKQEILPNLKYLMLVTAENKFCWFEVLC